MFWSPRRHGVHGAPCDWGITLLIPEHEASNVKHDLMIT